MATPRFLPLGILDAENPEKYRPGGYHPISIGDTFDHGRFRVLHKLGSGGFSTVWLARDQQEGKDQGKIVALKALRADISSGSPNENPEVAIPQQLRASLPPSCSVDFKTIDHHFVVQGPNGSHHFLISSLAGPSIFAMADYSWRSRQLRADLARKVAKQTATTLHHMHSAGIVHGDLTTPNILFRLSPHVIGWSDAEVYTHLGSPEMDCIMTCDGTPPGPHAPAMLTTPIESSKMSHASLLQESTIISDFGQSYVITSPPPSYEPGTLPNYLSPEARFERRAGFEADIWSLGCAIFEIRAGFPLFEYDSMLSSIDVLKQTVGTLGRLPDPWWAAFEQRARWFEEDGQPKSEALAYRTSIREKLLEMIGEDDPPSEDEGPMIEPPGAQLPEKELDLLVDLLQKMLKYRPEERIPIQDVIRHPWFAL